MMDSGTVSPRQNSGGVDHALDYDLAASQVERAVARLLAGRLVAGHRGAAAAGVPRNMPPGWSNTSPAKMNWSPGPGPGLPRSAWYCTVSCSKSVKSYRRSPSVPAPWRRGLPQLPPPTVSRTCSRLPLILSISWKLRRTNPRWLRTPESRAVRGTSAKATRTTGPPEIATRTASPASADGTKACSYSPVACPTMAQTDLCGPAGLSRQSGPHRVCRGATRPRRWPRFGRWPRRRPIHREPRYPD